LIFEDRAGSPDSTSSDDFSSPEFEKLDIASQSPSSAPVAEEEKDSKEEKPSPEDDHNDFRQKPEGHNPDRKPDDEDEEKRSQIVRTNLPSSVTEEPSENGSSGQRKTDDKTEQRDKSKSSTREKERDRSSKERSRSSSKISESNRSERRERSSSHRDHRKHDRSDRDRHRSSRKDESSDRRHRYSSDRKDRERNKSYRSDRDRSRDRRKHKKSSSSSSDKHKEVDPSTHPQAELWKRPDVKPSALYDYLAQFPSSAFDDNSPQDSSAIAVPLDEVSVSSVSSYDDSDVEHFDICLSEVEMDSGMEEAFLACAARITYKDQVPAQPNDDPHETHQSNVQDSAQDCFPPALPSEESPAKVEECLHKESKECGGDIKRIRKLNSRYNDSYVGSEWKKMESIIGNNHPLARINNLVNLIDIIINYQHELINNE